MKRVGLATFLKIAAAVAGILLIINLVSSAGWTEISRAFREHWPALILLIAVYTTYHLLRTLTLQICTPHPVRFTQLFGIRLAGEAIAYIAIGSVIGDTLKVALGRKTIPVVEGATGVFAEKLIYHLAGACFILGGLTLAVFRLGAHPVLFYLMFAMLTAFIMILFLLSGGRKPIAYLLRNVKVRKPRLRQAILKIEEQLFLFRKNHPKEFLTAFLVNFATYFYVTLEVAFILYLINQTPSFWDVWYYEAVVKAANSANVVVPGNLGVFEATNALLGRQLNWGDQAGLIVALFIRTRATIWSLIGYFWFVYLVSKNER